MSNFDFSSFNFFGNNSKNSSTKRADKQRRGRQCRIEELEGREMLSVSPWAIANDYDGQQFDQVQTQETLQPLANASDTALAAVDGFTALTKVKATVSANTIVLTGVGIEKNAAIASKRYSCIFVFHLFPFYLKR